MNKTVKDFSVVELKALAFDFISEMERLQANLRAVNQEIAERNKPVAESPKEEVKEAPKEEVK